MSRSRTRIFMQVETRRAAGSFTLIVIKLSFGDLTFLFRITPQISKIYFEIKNKIDKILHFDIDFRIFTHHAPEFAPDDTPKTAENRV